MIPDFPNFKSLALEDGETIDAFTVNYPCYSDFNFTSLWVWDTNRKRKLSILNGNLVIEFTDYETEEPFLTYLGTRDTRDTALTLLDYSESLGYGSQLKLVPELSVFDIEYNTLKIEFDKANFDYIYLTSRLATLPGFSYNRKKRSVQQFERENPDHSFRICDLRDVGVQREIEAIANAWKPKKERELDTLRSIEHEQAALRNLFDLVQTRDMITGIVFRGGTPRAFTIEEMVAPRDAMGHFWKTAEIVKGEYEYMAREMARHLLSLGIDYWNWEQDLGIETLRISKSSYRPSDFLRKFTVENRMQW